MVGRLWLLRLRVLRRGLLAMGRDAARASPGLGLRRPLLERVDVVQDRDLPQAQHCGGCESAWLWYARHKILTRKTSPRGLHKAQGRGRTGGPGLLLVAKNPPAYFSVSTTFLQV